MRPQNLQESIDIEKDVAWPLALQVLEKLCRRFPEASQEEIFKKFWDLARDDKDIMHSATWLGITNYLEDTYERVMKRISTTRPKRHRSRKGDTRVWRAE
jgi:hypothetical protein